MKISKDFHSVISAGKNLQSLQKVSYAISILSRESFLEPDQAAGMQDRVDYESGSIISALLVSLDRKRNA